MKSGGGGRSWIGRGRSWSLACFYSREDLGAEYERSHASMLFQLNFFKDLGDRSLFLAEVCVDHGLRSKHIRVSRR